MLLLAVTGEVGRRVGHGGRGGWIRAGASGANGGLVLRLDDWLLLLLSMYTVCYLLTLWLGRSLL